MAMKEIKTREIDENVFKMIADEWMLICAGDENRHNMMTASWGFLGEMWGKECSTVAIRPSRYTFDLVENSDTYALCFMGDMRDVYNLCGKESGRDTDKVKATELTPVFEDGTMYFEEARLVLICKKMYADDLKPECFTDKAAAQKWYNNDFHRMFTGEITKVLVNTEK